MTDSDILKDFLKTFSFSSLANLHVQDIKEAALREKASTFAKELLKIKYVDIATEIKPEQIHANDIIDFSFRFIGVHSTGTCGWNYTNAYLNFYLIPSDYGSFMKLFKKAYSEGDRQKQKFFLDYIRKWYIDNIISFDEPDGYTHNDFLSGICDIVEQTMRYWVHWMPLTYEMMDKQQWKTIYVGKEDDYITFSSKPREGFIPFLEIVKGTDSPFKKK